MRPASKASCCATGGSTAPGHGMRERPAAPLCTVDAAAQAARLAVAHGAAGIYNIAEDDGAVSIAKARRELGFDPAFRISATVS